MFNEDHIASQKRENDTSPGEAGSGRTRILARQLARPLTAEEIEVVAGGLRMVGGTCSAGTCCVPDCDD
jgi:hypothetical protein